MDEERGRLQRAGLPPLAYARGAGRTPTVVFLPGFASDMEGEKAQALADVCAARGQAVLRFDYSGHGASGGRFEEGTIGRWRDDALDVIDALSDGPLVLVGSSMGGWLALLVALARPARLAGLIGIAAAPDFTERLMWASMPFSARETLMCEGRIMVPSAYGAPYPITRALIEDGRRHLLLDGPIALTAPVRLLHGQADPDVPWELSLRLAEQITGADVTVTLIKDGDHRLSRPADLALLRRTLGGLVAGLGGEDGG
jgi:pimeloyl-ACP methyl ester carboxylesterase